MTSPGNVHISGCLFYGDATLRQTGNKSLVYPFEAVMRMPEVDIGVSASGMNFTQILMIS